MIAEASQFETIVRERSWDWLLELQRRLGVELQLIGGELTPLLPSVPPGGDLVGLLTQPRSPLQSVVAAALRFRRPQSLTVEGHHVVCVAIGAGRRAPGILVVSRTASEASHETERVRNRLDVVASWVTTAIEAHIGSPPGMHASGVDRVSPLCRALAYEGRPRTDRDVVRAFGEALAIWFDVDICGYVETERGFVREVSLPGATADAYPSLLPELGLPDAPTLTRVPPALADRFGFARGSHALVARLGQLPGSAWLIVASGPIEAADIERLDACLAVLRVSLATHDTSAAADVAAATSSALMNGGPLETAASQALFELRIRVDASVATLRIDGPSERHALRASSSREDAGRARDSARVEIARPLEGGGAVRVTLEKADDRPFSPQQYRMAVTAAEAFSRWSQGIPEWHESGRGLRRSESSFERDLEHFAAQALDRDTSATVLVVRAHDARDTPALLGTWVSGVRGQLRASDMVGVLTENEIAVLLHDADADSGTRAAARVRALVTSTPDVGVPSIGVATRRPGDVVHGIVREARAQAARPAAAAAAVRREHRR